MNIFGSKVPKWVNSLDTEDREVISHLIKQGANLSDARTINFSTYGYKDRELARKVMAIFNAAGWTATYDQQADDPTLFVVDANKQDYVITYDSFINDKAYFVEVAMKNDAEYDGWSASI